VGVNGEKLKMKGEDAEKSRKRGVDKKGRLTKPPLNADKIRRTNERRGKKGAVLISPTQGRPSSLVQK